MSLESTPLFDIKELAESISMKFESKATPLLKISDEEGLKIYSGSYETTSFDGITIYDNKRFYIHLNTDRGNTIASVRGRFTLAHELGHYFIDTHRIGLKKGKLKPHPSYYNQEQYDRIEKEADYFASCLLMPEEKFLSDIYRKKFSPELINQLCENYQVSKTACAIRFSLIGNHPIMVVYAEKGFIKWRKASDDFPYKSLIKAKSVPENTVMGDYFADTNRDNTYKTEQVFASDWFYTYSKDDYRRKFYEYCISSGSNALSILWED